MIAVVGAGLRQSYDRPPVAKEHSESAENQSIQAGCSAQIKVYNIKLIDSGMAAQVDKGLKPIVEAAVPRELGYAALLNHCQPRVHQQTEMLECSKEPEHGDDTNPTSGMFSAKLGFKPQQSQMDKPAVFQLWWH